MERYFQALKKRACDVNGRIKGAYRTLFAPHTGALHLYNQEYPHPQQMINLFENEWLSCFPPPFQDLKAGIYPLFEDRRLEWGIEQLGGVANKRVVELGPLEGGHSYMLQRQGVASVIAIEANPRAFLKCLLVKQMMALERVNFLFGDFNAYLHASSEKFDLCVASGVLYHMQDPVGLLAAIAQKSQELFLWTQYYDAKICADRLQAKFLAPFQRDVQGFKHTLHPFRYGASRFWSTFIGGPAKTSCWLTRQAILDALSYFGFKDIQVGFEEIHPAHGPCLALVAKKDNSF